MTPASAVPILHATAEEHLRLTRGVLAHNQPASTKRWLEERLVMLEALAHEDEDRPLRLHYGFPPYMPAEAPAAPALDEVKRCIDAARTQPANARQVGGTHYKDMGVQPWEVIDTWPIEQRIGFYRGNLLRYTMRMGSKDAAVQEIGKAGHYAQKLAEVLAEAGKGSC